MSTIWTLFLVILGCFPTVLVSVWTLPNITYLCLPSDSWKETQTELKRTPEAKLERGLRDHVNCSFFLPFLQLSACLWLMKQRCLWRQISTMETHFLHSSGRSTKFSETSLFPPARFTSQTPTAHEPLILHVQGSMLSPVWLFHNLLPLLCIIGCGLCTWSMLIG